MFLYLIRHGDAEMGAMPDEQRGLTPAGLTDIQKISKHISRMEGRPEQLFSSPFLRAKQSAEPFSQSWDLKIQAVDWLLPGVAPSQVLGELRKYSEEGIALVGHLPNLGLVLGTLVWGLPPKEVVIPKSGVAFLNLTAWDPGTAKLQWLLTPKSIFSS